MIVKNFILGKRGQEEIVGFAIIVIIVAVILLFALTIGLNSGMENVESFEVDSFIQSFLQYTTECRDNLESFSVQQLVFECNLGSSCSDGRESCVVLQETLRELSLESWNVGPQSPVKGYELEILVNNEQMLLIGEGNVTNSFKGSVQNFARSSDSVNIVFRAYF